MNEYDLTEAFQRIEYELMSSMIRNMDRHRAEETEEGYNWSMWQAGKAERKYAAGDPNPPGHKERLEGSRKK